MPRLSLVPASYVYLRRGGEVLLQLRENTGYRDGCWAAGAAGHIEAGETAVVAARRELAEELGVDAEVEALVATSVMQRTDGTADPTAQRVDWFFVCDRWAGEPTIREPAKCGGLDWFGLDNLPETVADYERLALRALAAGATSHLQAFGFRGPGD
ncbi:MAG: NUDIX domain-containing protein [Nocardioides sp.]|uniref:NUDIX hydrolase n=1 Tax=Nocardioides sp. TaxID=35761 RepID=UPI0039E6DAE8